MVTIIIDYGDNAGGSKLEITNDRTGTKEFGNYDLRFEQHGLEIAKWRVERFPRWMGIELLAAKALHDLSLSDGWVDGEDREYGGTTPMPPLLPDRKVCPLCGEKTDKFSAAAEQGLFER